MSHNKNATKRPNSPTRIFPSNSNHKTIETRRAVYQTVVALRTFEERCADGTQSKITIEKDGWILKSDLVGGDTFVANELSIYFRLRELWIAPEADHNYFVSAPDTIRIKQINHGGTLLEYSVAYSNGLVSDQLWQEICNEVKRVLSIFFAAGFVHGDLHARNILIELTVEGFWKAYIIDFATSFNLKTKKQDLENLAQLAVFFEVIPNQIDDIEILFQDLGAIKLHALEDIWDEVVAEAFPEELEGDFAQVTALIYEESEGYCEY